MLAEKSTETRKRYASSEGRLGFGLNGVFCEGCVWVRRSTEACLTGTVPAHCCPEGTTVLPPSARHAVASSHAFCMKGKKKKVIEGDETASTRHWVCFHTNADLYAGPLEDWWEVLALDALGCR